MRDTRRNNEGWLLRPDREPVGRSSRESLLVHTEYRAKLRPFVAGDIETAGLGGAYLLGAIRWPLGVVEFFDDPGAMLGAFLRPEWAGYELLFHNADYDTRYLLPVLQYLGYRSELVLSSYGRVIYVTIHGPGRRAWYIRDTYALMRAPLADLGELAGTEKLDIGLHSGVQFDPADPVHREYLARDVEVLAGAYGAFVDTLRSGFGVAPAYTIGSTAVRAWRATLPSGRAHWRQRPGVEAIGRRAAYGALNWLTTTAPQYDCVQIDMHAAYATAMRAGVPVGTAAYTLAEVKGRPGIYECRVYAPASIPFTFIPHRLAGGAVALPYGSWTGYLTSPTIRLARERGYRVEVGRGFYWPELSTDVFGPFCNACEHLEGLYTTGARKVIKALRNNLYGKLLQAPTARRYYMQDNGDGPGGSMLTPVMDDSGDLVPGLWFSEVKAEAAHIRPEWGAWVLAEARNNLARAVYAIGPEHCYYGDTDSIIGSRAAILAAVEAGRIEVGPGYGQWAEVGRYDVWRARNTKLYAGVTGDWSVVRAAGIGRGILSAADVIGPEPLPVTEPRIPSAINLLRGAAAIHEVEQEPGEVGHNPAWLWDSTTGAVRPVTVSELTTGGVL